MIESFEFSEGGRTFRCRAAARGGSAKEMWWWFGVSSGDNHQYAPFRAEPQDTEAEVRTRIVAYYDNLLARRAMPSPTQFRRGRPPAPKPEQAPVS